MATLALRRGFPKAGNRNKALMTRNAQNAARIAQLQRSNFDGSGQLVESLQASDFAVIGHGEDSIFNAEQKLHRNRVNIKIKNNDPTNPANVVITAGIHDGNAKYSGKLMPNGTGNTTNNNGDTVSVTGSVSMGIDATVSNIVNLRSLIKEHGVLVSETRYRYTDADQITHKVLFNHFDYFGNHNVDYIDPEVYFDPKQYHEKVLDFGVGYVLNRNTIMEVTVEPGETIILSVLIEKVMDLDELLKNNARRSGSNIIV